MTEKKASISGTREWAVAEIDCCTGCPHGCRYCYARYKAVVVRKEVSPESWRIPAIREADVSREYPRYDGQVMFPANHDIVPEILEECVEVLRRLIAAGNRVLVVSKPHLSCIEEICNHFVDRRGQILFRFTITAADDELLRFWEPQAPPYSERLASLRHAASRNFATSVSIEPMLDSAGIVALVAELTPHVSHSIWIGKMNKAHRRCMLTNPEAERRMEAVLAGQRDENILRIYHRLKDHHLVRWKESIKQVVGLPGVQHIGEDR